MIQEPAKEVIQSILGENSFLLYNEICHYINDNYVMECVWDNGGKYGQYVLRFQRSKKTLCTLYIREKQLGVWIIFGKAERDKFESLRNNFCVDILNHYDTTEIYHDGKWLMLDLSDNCYIEDIKQMLLIKKKPLICKKCDLNIPNGVKEKKSEVIDGYTIKYHANGTTVWSKGMIINDHPEGYWEWYRPDGTVKRSGYFEQGEPMGEWITYDNKGKKYKTTKRVKKEM